jgi:phosphopantothenoylcysteine decarboxylase/phosphopantothenate--cysteine ligase
MSRILLGVSGGIAAYKALEVVRLATAAGHAVRVIQTPASLRFVGRASFAALTGAPVLVSEFERDPALGAFPGDPLPAHEPLSHLALAANADIYLIAPASANTLARLAGGHAQNLLTSSALAAPCPVIVAPAMNNHMYEHAATQANLRTLRERGVAVIEPGVGRLASKGEEGVGRLAEPAEILAACETVLALTGAVASPPARNGTLPQQPPELTEAGPEDAPDSDVATAQPGALQGLRVLITAGGTREPIDSVRYIGNSSSGRMGLALAQVARDRGADVRLVAANLALERLPGIVYRDVSSARELEQACADEFPACDVLIMAAAVADFRPADRHEGKLKRSGRDHLELTLEPTADVLAGLVARRRDGQTLVGFAAEHGEQALANGREKLLAKGVDLLVVNDISREDIGFGADANEVTLLLGGTNGSAIDERPIPRAPKEQVAGQILDVVERLRSDS